MICDKLKEIKEINIMCEANTTNKRHICPSKARRPRRAHTIKSPNLGVLGKNRGVVRREVRQERRKRVLERYV